MAEPRPSTDQENAPLLERGGGEGERPPIGTLFNPSTFTAREKLLAVLGLLLLILSGTFIGLFAGAEHSLKKERKHHHYPEATKTVTKTVNGPAPTDGPGKSVCLSPACVQAAAGILQALNTSVDPCDDFYNFANGGWMASHTLPADRGRFATFDEVGDNNRKIMVKILESIPKKFGKSVGDPTYHESNLAKLRDTYTSCMDIETLDKFGIESLLEMVHNATEPFGSFNLDPMPDDDSLTDDDWRGAYTEDYVIPDAIRVPADRAPILRDAKRNHALISQPEQAKAAELDLNPTHTVDDKRRRKITQALAYLHSRGVDTLFQFAMEGNAGGNNSQISTLFLYQSFGSLPSKEYYEEKPILDLYHSVVSGILTEVAEGNKSEQKRGMFEVELMQELAADLVGEVDDEGWPWPWPGDDKEPEDTQPSEPLKKRMDKLASQVVKFEQKIARAGADLELLFNPSYSYNPTKTKDVQKALPFFDISEYIATMGTRSYPSEIIVTHPPYLKSITELVSGVPDHVLSAYFVIQLSIAYGGALGPETGVRKEIRRLKEVLSGLKPGTIENRQDVCLAAVDKIVGFIGGAEYVREAFSPEAKEDGSNIIRSIVTAFHDKLPHISWMDKESYTAAQKKANSLIPKVGYPLSPDTTDPLSLWWYYRPINIGKNHFDNVVQSEVVDVRRAWALLGSERDRQSWEMNPQTVNAYYSPPDGEIVFPAGIMQPPFYSLDWPTYLKYGAFGSVAAHELTHAFDNTGAQYNDKGLLRDWWTNSTVKEFSKRAQCLAEQYSKYYIVDAEGKKHYINGNGTLGENIGDSGLSQAFAAWQATVNDKPVLNLPGLQEFTPEQLFFISFARVWATLIRPATAVSLIRTDPHSPGYWRAIGTLRNNEAFHRAFKCKKGSPMNPEHQCYIWE